MNTEMLHELCDTLTDELEEVNSKIRRANGNMNSADLDTIDKLSHALKSIKTTIAMIEADDGYSRGYEPRMGTYRDARGVSYDGYSGRRRDSMGRYSRRGYSYADGMDSMIEEMRGMMSDLPADKQQKVQRIISEMERV